MEAKRGCTCGHPWVPRPPRWAVLQSPAKAGMPGMQNPGTLPCRPPPPRPRLPPASPSRHKNRIFTRATYTHTRLVIRKKHSVSVWNGLSLTVWPPGPSSWGRRESARSRWGTAKRAAVGWSCRGHQHGEGWRRASSAGTALPSPSGPSPAALPPGRAAGQRGEPLQRGASSPMAGVRLLTATVKPGPLDRAVPPAPSPRVGHPESCQHVPASSMGSAKTSCLR